MFLTNIYSDTNKMIYAKYKTYSKKKSPAEIIWESCKDGLNFDFDFEDEPEPTSTTDNVIKLESYREEV